MNKFMKMFLVGCVLAISCFAADVDMSQYSCATILTKGIEAMSPDVPYLNDIETRRYVTEIDNWKKNRDAGTVAPIPDPPMAYELVADLATCSAWVKRGTTPVVAKYVEPVVPTPSIAGALVPPFAPGRYLCVFKDNAPAGYRLTTKDGVLVQKVINLSPFGPMPEYNAVK